jgi:hypothetical protein
MRYVEVSSGLEPEPELHHFSILGVKAAVQLFTTERKNIYTALFTA